MADARSLAAQLQGAEEAVSVLRDTAETVHALLGTPGSEIRCEQHCRQFAGALERLEAAAHGVGGIRDRLRASDSPLAALSGRALAALLSRLATGRRGRGMLYSGPDLSPLYDPSALRALRCAALSHAP